MFEIDSSDSEHKAVHQWIIFLRTIAGGL